MFPVTFATFERYIDAKRLLHFIVHKHTKDEALSKVILADKTKCRKILQKYYNTFYIFPNKRKLDKFSLKKAPPTLYTQLLKEGLPLDEMAVKTVESYTK